MILTYIIYKYIYIDRRADRQTPVQKQYVTPCGGGGGHNGSPNSHTFDSVLEEISLKAVPYSAHVVALGIIYDFPLAAF